MKHNFIKVAVASPKVAIGHPIANTKEILQIIKSDQKNAIFLFPELAIPGYSLGDWIFNREVIQESYDALALLLENNDNHLVIVGTLLEYNSALYNVSVVIEGSKILGIIPKVYLPRNNEFYDSRFFVSGESFFENPTQIEVLGQKVNFGSTIFTSSNDEITFGVEICADAWSPASPNNTLYLQGAEVVFNCSASTFYVGKSSVRVDLCRSASLKGCGAYIYTSSGASETSSDVLYTGHQIVSVNGDIILNNEQLTFESCISYVDIDMEAIKYARLTKGWFNTKREKNIIPKIGFTTPKYENYCFDTLPSAHPFVTSVDESNQIIDVVTCALYKRMCYAKADGMVLGISGGLDSTLALLMCVEMAKRYQFDLKKIHACTLPALATTSTSKNIAKKLMAKLNVDDIEIPIGAAVEEHLEMIGHDQNLKDVTYENAQARYRTLVLMNYANKSKSLVVGTGDMSEIALGWCTFNGDHMSMYNINSGLPKTAVKNLVNHFISKYPEIKDELLHVVNALITPELTSGSQSTEAIIGKYEVNDFIMYQILARGSSKDRLVVLLNAIFNLSNDEASTYYDNFMKRFKSQQYKRLSGPEGIKVFEVSLSPRSDFRMPGDMK